MEFKLKILKYKWFDGHRRVLHTRIPSWSWMGLATIMLLLLGNNNGLVAITVALFCIGGFFKEHEDWDYYENKKKEK